MKELDLLLQRWLETQFRAGQRRAARAVRGPAGAAGPELARYLLGGRAPERPELAPLIDCSLAGARIMSRARRREPSAGPAL